MLGDRDKVAIRPLDDNWKVGFDQTWVPGLIRGDKPDGRPDRDLEFQSLPGQPHGS